MSKRPHSNSELDESATKRRDTRHVESFSVRPAQHYAGRCAIYKQPVEINSYSIDGERCVWFDDRELKQYHPIRIDGTTPSLSTGFERFVKRDDTVAEHLDTLLDAITDAKRKKRALGDLDIVTWRGIMTKIFCTPYARNEPWQLRVSRSNGTIYMEEVALPGKKEREANATRREQMMSYWGYRFEGLCTNDPDGSANTNIQYCVIVKTRLGKNNILMGAEVDCIDGPKSKEPLKQYIELKTSRHIENSRQQYSFERYKLLKFWAQSFLVGVPRVVCGFRDDDGSLTKTETLKTLEIPRRVRDKPNMWDASVCLNFADQFLDWLRTVVTVDDPNTTYSVEWKEPFKEITVRYNGRIGAFLTQRYFDGDVSHNIGGPRVSLSSLSSNT